MTISKFLKKSKNLTFDEVLLYELAEREPGRRSTARCHTETVAKSGSPGPTKTGTTRFKMIESPRFCSMNSMKSQRKLVKRILKIKIELIKHENANATISYVGPPIFKKNGK